MAKPKLTEDDPEQSQRFREAAAEAAGEQNLTEDAFDQLVERLAATRRKDD